ncbi:MAG: hypothetical protein QME55_02190 [Brevundimonas sp.]|uniref:hypothetical protein n=1 Tax=Brevundimonas sp. TaxID=1871086 RepID=UPI0026087C93|nr:hypothetical protein [Brevundimonas sp.]MDI6623515.1 hypothetical protein [Brevundimonas sp.]MDQ7813200.1 hypothetical protein [Brevundimonas sp.]
MTDLPEPDEPPRPGHRIHPPETWERARDDYLAGLSGPAVCARYGLGLAAFRKRAATGGWRRIDQPAPMPSGPIELDGDIHEADYFDLAELAAIHLREAIVNGRAAEAAAWLRIHFRLDEAAVQEAALRRELGDDEVDEVDGIDPVFSAPGSTVTPGSRRPPETPALPPSSPAPAPGCDAESGRSGR